MCEMQIVRLKLGNMVYDVQVEPDKEDGGYVAEVAGLPGCITDGDTLEETLEMARDAIACWLEAHEDLKRAGIELPMGARKPKQETPSKRT